MAGKVIPFFAAVLCWRELCNIALRPRGFLLFVNSCNEVWGAKKQIQLYPRVVWNGNKLYLTFAEDIILWKVRNYRSPQNKGLGKAPPHQQAPSSAVHFLGFWFGFRGFHRLSHPKLQILMGFIKVWVRQVVQQHLGVSELRWFNFFFICLPEYLPFF